MSLVIMALKWIIVGVSMLFLIGILSLTSPYLVKSDMEMVRILTNGYSSIVAD
ncbi:hypothetical protein ACT3CD_10155 [Geofilum sp. OHC36d9]|uniref:hypothetical protein n=1 Tax=Geofilum sp. OHC36d9 TaxID=3458413 RepID=UPI004034DA9D